jgi:hypothetical protein
MKVLKPVLLLESCLAQVPLVVGHMRPAILVPLGFLAGLPSEQVELLLMHELAHIRRADYVINMLQTFAESVMFYNRQSGGFRVSSELNASTAVTMPLWMPPTTRRSTPRR